MLGRVGLDLLSRFPIVRAALARVREAGAEPADLIQRFGLPRTAETDCDIILPLRTMHAFMDAVGEVTGEPLVGLQLPARLQRGTYGVFEYLLWTAKDVRQLLRATSRYTPLVSEVLVASFVERDDAQGRRIGVLRHELPGEPLCLGRHVNECLLAMMLGIVRQSTGQAISPVATSLAHPEPPTRAALEAALGLEGITYGHGSSCIILPASALDLPLVGADPVLHEILVESAERQLAARSGESRLLGQIKQIVRDELRDRLPTLEGTALALGTSPRALQRRFTKLDTRFQDVVDGVRQEIACERLREGAAVGAVAFELQYSDESAFVRAFKRWTGTTPGAFREKRAAS